MPRRSAVIDHPERERIEALIRAGQPRSAIARQLDVPYPALKRHARRLLAGDTPTPAPTEPLDAVATFAAAFDQVPTDYQVAVLTDTRPTIVLKSRQSGFTQAAAALSICCARSAPGRDVVVVSPSLQQSKEVTTRARTGLYNLEEDLVQDAAGLLRLRNNSRVISLPGSQRAIRGYSPALVIADEAAWIEDASYAAIRPLLAASGGRLVAQSTPGARVGWFFDLWESDLDEGWLRLEVPAERVPFIDAEFLARERRELPPETYAAEYQVTFGAALGVPPLFDLDLLDRLAIDDEEVA